MRNIALDTVRMNALPMLQMLYKRPEDEILDRIRKLRHVLGERLLILAHHYQREEVYAFADRTGDSLKLAREAARTDAPFYYLLWCPFYG